MCLGLLCCCLGPAACGLCGSMGSKAKTSITTRLLYMLFLIFAVVAAAFLLSSHVQDGLADAVGRGVHYSALIYSHDFRTTGVKVVWECMG